MTNSGLTTGHSLVANKITNCDYTLAIDTIVSKPFEMLGD